MSLNLSIYELCAHNIHAILEILATTCSCVFNEHKIFNYLVSYATSVKVLMLYEIENLNKTEKYRMPQKDCIDR